MKVSLKVLISFLIVFLSQGVFAQQITKFGVVDTARVYNAYFRDSAAVRNYEKKKSYVCCDLHRDGIFARGLRQGRQRRCRYADTEPVCGLRYDGGGGEACGI